MSRVGLRSLVLLTLAAQHAQAQGAGDKAAADALYDEARRLLASGAVAAACPKLEESQRLDPGVGTLLTLAECYAASNRTASAWSTFREAAALAAKRRQPDREKVARDKAAALEPKLGKLEIRGATADGTVVKRDGAAVGAALFATAIPVDSGPHEIEASAPGKTTWTKRVTVVDGETAVVDIPQLAPAPVGASTTAPPPTAAPPPPPAAATSPSPPTAVVASGGNSTRTVGLVLGAAGVLVGGVGVYFGLDARSKHDRAAEQCTPTCREGGGAATQDDAWSSVRKANVAFALGGALAVGGAVLFVTAPSAKSGRVAVAPLVGSAGGGVALTGELP